MEVNIPKTECAVSLYINFKNEIKKILSQQGIKEWELRPFYHL